MKKNLVLSLFAALATSSAAALAEDHPTSFYPELTRSDIAVCRPQFAAMKADLVEHYRLQAADAAPGGKHPFADNQTLSLRLQQQTAAKDPLDLYIEGVIEDGEGFGNLAVINKLRDEGSLNAWKRAVSAPVPPPDSSDLLYGLTTGTSDAAADKCVGRIFLTKYYAMHPDNAPPEFALAAKAGSRATTANRSVSAAVAARNNPAGVGTSGGAAVSPLRPIARLEANNPANEASICLQLIRKREYAAHGVRSNMGAVFRNKCSYPVETRWCIGEERCTTGYDNLATMPARGTRGISYDDPARTSLTVRWAACRQGFADRPDFRGTLHYACK